MGFQPVFLASAKHNLRPYYKICFEEVFVLRTRKGLFLGQVLDADRSGFDGQFETWSRKAAETQN